MSLQPVPRPGIVNLIAIASFVLSAVNAIWVFAWIALILFASAASWFAGPVAGALGTAIGFLFIAILVVQFFLSLLLFSAAWNTWDGRPAGRSRHKKWAWIIVVLDLITLVCTGGIDPSAWTRLIYAVLLIYILDKPEVRAYFDQRSLSGA